MALDDETRSTGGEGVAAAIFASRIEAENALLDLREHGFRPESIGVVMRHLDEAKALAQTVADTEAEEGAVAGAVAGAALGGIAGWLVGVGALAVPGLGPILAAGPLAIAIGAAVVGATTGGLVGVLAGEGIPEENARWYEREVRTGAVLVTVRADTRQAKAREVLHRWGGRETESGEGRADALG